MGRLATRTGTQGRRIYTCADILAFPEDNGLRREILDGELFEMTPPSLTHQRMVGRLFWVLANYLRGNDIGEVFVSPVGVAFSETSFTIPDLVFVSKKRRRILAERGIEGSPDLVVEVLSPATRSLDLHRKFDLYARRRVPHYWIIDPGARSLDAYRLTRRGYRRSIHVEGTGVFQPSLFPGLEISLAEVRGPAGG